MKEFEIEVSKTVHDYFIAETEDEAVDMAVQKFDNESADIYTLVATAIGEDKFYQPAVNEFNADSLIKMADEELESLKATLYKQIDAIDTVKRTRLEKTQYDAIQAFNEAVKKILDLGLGITVFDTDGYGHEVFDKQNIEVIM